MYATFNRFELKLTKAQAAQGSHPGPCDADVAELLKVPAIRKQFEKIEPEKIAAELQEYGAWDETELQDTEANKARILWIACGDIVDNLPTPNKHFGKG
jgi:hypothetical protein